MTASTSFSTMGWRLVLPLLMIFCMYTCSVLANHDPTEEQATPLTARQQYELPRLFDFERFKTLFKKTYKRLSEDLARKKLYLGRAFRVFLSAVAYKYRKASSYLAINEMSDWTPEEVHKIYPKRALREAEEISPLPKQALRGADKQSTREVLPIADVREIEQKLAQIVERRNEPALKEVADELQAEVRRKRAASDFGHRQRRHLDLDDLMRAPGKSKDEVVRVPSNNPHYEELELKSYGDGERKHEELTGEEADLISKLPGYSYLSSLVQGLQSAWFGSEPQAASNSKGVHIPVVWQAPVRGRQSGTHGNSIEVNQKHVAPHTGDDEEYFDASNQFSANDNTEARSEEGDVVWVDYRVKSANCYMAVRSQGSCGSCYAFAAVALYEWHYCSQTQQRVALSEQYVIDCGATVNLHGCDGGIFTRISDFVQKLGLELRANYPYREHQDQCPYELDRDIGEEEMSKMGYLRIQDDGFLPVHYTQFGHYLRFSPMVINVKVSDKFSEYGGGVDDPTLDCEDDRTHSMLLIGHGREDGQEYWLIRNSHSVSWGEAGHYKMSTGAVSCLDNDHAYYLSNVRLAASVDPKRAKRVSPQVRRQQAEYMRAGAHDQVPWHSELEALESRYY